MGKGAIAIGQVAEMTIPSLLLFAIVFAAAQKSLRLKSGGLVILGLWLLTLVTSGFVNVALYSITSRGGTGSIVFMSIPLIVSLFVVFFIAPRKPPEVSAGGTPNKSLERTRDR